MALRDPLSLEPPQRPGWQSGVPDKQVGQLAEDLLGVAIASHAAGYASVAIPTLDRGIDIYVRRVRSLLTLPIQVKAFRDLNLSGEGALDIPVDETDGRPGGYLAIVHLPAPHDVLYERLFLMSFAEFSRRCPRHVVDGVESFHFRANFSGRGTDGWQDSLWDISRLGEFLRGVPGWSKTFRQAMTTAAPEDEQPDATNVWLGNVGRLWVASEIERDARGSLAIALDRVRLDPVSLLVHHLSTGRIAGIHVRTARISNEGRVQWNVLKRTFFAEPAYYVLFVIVGEQYRVHDFCLLVPSEEVANLGFSGSITLAHLTHRFEPYRVESSLVAQTFLNKVFGA